MSTITGKIYKATNQRPKVTYGYVTLDDETKVDVIAFPNTQAKLSRDMLTWSIGDTVTLEGEIDSKNAKNQYAMQFKLSAVVTERVTYSPPTGEPFNFPAPVIEHEDAWWDLRIRCNDPTHAGRICTY